jgi:hypothetical protein
MSGISACKRFFRAMLLGMIFPSVAMIAFIFVQKFYGKPPRTKTADQVYKNIRVLKGIPAEELYAKMVSFNTALGVTCEFCHVFPTYYKDTKKSKQETRRMILLQMTINRDHFNGQERVTCYSCHRGSVEVPIGD